MALAEKKVRLFVENKIATISLERLSNLNALDAEMLSDIVKFFRHIEKKILEESDSVRIVLIKSECSKAFVAGADINYMGTLGPRALEEYIELGHRAMRSVYRCKVPVISVVKGYALGGGFELALATDIILASKDAVFGLPEVNLGIIPGFGGTQKLILRCGIGVAKRLVFSGDKVGAHEARDLGIVDVLILEDNFEEEVNKFISKVLSVGPLALRKARELINFTEESFNMIGLRKEIEAFNDLFITRDREEGFDAFVQKRKPEFKGN